MSAHTQPPKAAGNTVEAATPYPLESDNGISIPSVESVGQSLSKANGSTETRSSYHTPVDESTEEVSSLIGDDSLQDENTRNLPGKPLGAPFAQPNTHPGSPVISGVAPIGSPVSQPLSQASSQSNLNVVQGTPMPNRLYSKSDNNLAVIGTPSMLKLNHNRSVSSGSSNLPDRSDNASIVDFSQSLIQQYLGNNSSHLLPRIKTIELYRRNAKKSNDPTVLFQYAQYMLQTALMLDSNDLVPSQSGTSNPSPPSSQNQSITASPLKQKLDKKTSSSSLSLNTDILRKAHKKSRSSLSFDVSHESIEDTVEDKKLKAALLKEAIHYLRKLSDKGYVEAQYLLGDAHSSGALGKVDHKEAFLLFQAAAKHGHVESAYRTSYCYEEGSGVGRDARKAVEFLKSAASKNHPAAMYKLGVYSFYGRMGLGNHINTKKMGIKWLTRAANVANELIAAAPYELGKIYFEGFKDIVIPDKKYALELYTQAAALGHIESAALLGQFYNLGDIVPQDSNLSIHYFTQAALGGHPQSMLDMCAWYLVGNEPHLPKDDNEAFEWAKRAALCNLPKAQFALGTFLEKGIGCTQDPETAQQWYQRAAENGEKKALERIKNKDTMAKIQKDLKKKPRNVSGATPQHFDSKSKASAQDKDCVIM